MAITIPQQVIDLMNVYGLPWPDIDEDAFHEMKVPLREFGSDLHEVGAAMDEALRLLESSNPSRTLQAVTTYLQAIRSDFLDPIDTVCADLAGQPCDLAYDAVRTLKEGLLAALGFEVVNDIVDLVTTIFTVGLDAPAMAAEAAAVGEEMSALMDAAETAVPSLLQSVAQGYIDRFVTGLVDPFIHRISADVEAAVDGYMPHLVLRQTVELELSAGAGGDGGGRLHLDEHELGHCVESIVASSYHLDRAATKLASAVEELFSHPAWNAPAVPGLSSVLRTTLKGVVHAVQADFVGQVKLLVEAVIKHFVSLLHDFRNALADLDEQARAAAARKHGSGAMPLAVVSAAGVVGVAASAVRAATGAIDAREADRVSAAPAAVGAQTETLDARVDDAPLVREVAATARDVQDDLHVRVDRPNVHATAAGPAGTEPAAVQLPHDTAGPHVAAAQSGPGPDGTVGGHAASGQTVHVAAADGPSASGATPGLDASHHERHEPAVATAQSTSAHQVGQVRAAPKDVPHPTAEPATADAAGTVDADG